MSADDETTRFYRQGPGANRLRAEIQCSNDGMGDCKGVLLGIADAIDSVESRLSSIDRKLTNGQNTMSWNTTRIDKLESNQSRVVWGVLVAIGGAVVSFFKAFLVVKGGQ